MKSLYVLAGAIGVLALTVVTPTHAQDRPQGGGGGGVHGGGGGMGAAGGGGMNGPAGSSGMSGMSGGTASGSSSGGGFAGGAGGGGSASGVSGGSGIDGSSYSGPSPMGGMRSAMAERNGRAAGGGAALRSGLSRSAASADPNNAAVPGGSRPNYGNAPSSGTAVTRGSANTGGGGGTDNGLGQYDYSPESYWWYYGSSVLWDSSYPYWTVGYGCPWGSPADCYRSRYFYNPFFRYGYGAFGLGAFYFDPAWWGTGLSGYGLDASNLPMFPEEALGGGGWSDDDEDAESNVPSGPKGGLKLKVSPKTAEVYVDGYYMGLVDDYDGAFQRLNLPAGKHHFEIRAAGYQPIGFDATIEARDTISFHGAMQPLQPVK